MHQGGCYNSKSSEDSQHERVRGSQQVSKCLLQLLHAANQAQHTASTHRQLDAFVIPASLQQVSLGQCGSLLVPHVADTRQEGIHCSTLGARVGEQALNQQTKEANN